MAFDANVVPAAQATDARRETDIFSPITSTVMSAFRINVSRYLELSARAWASSPGNEMVVFRDKNV